MINLLLMTCSWFETARERVLTMRDLILRSGLFGRVSMDEEFSSLPRWIAA
jgi:hypothetical protein